MLSTLALSFGLSLTVTLVLVRTLRANGGAAADHDFSSPQKFHARAVPRIGGLGIFAGVALALLVGAWRYPSSQEGSLLLLAASLPAFAAGLMEDVTKRITPSWRMLALAVSGVLGAELLGARISHTAIPGLDELARLPLGSLLLAVFVVAGVGNSINIIDGFNGLASMCSIIMLTGVAAVAFTVGDPWIGGVALTVVAAVVGFFIWNYPMGLIFLGDGGAYFLGFVLAELSILLLVRNPAVSPLFPLLLCGYPVVETVFSMYRRKVVRGRPVGMPDGVHLHSLIYRRLMRWAIGSRDAQVLTRRNSMTAPYLWVVCSLSAIPAVVWWDDTRMLALCLALFAAGYVSMYWRIVKFRTPRWMVLRR
ncbi:MraY family glycosyltransferase [Roseateles sp. DB2]|uniref:MraY family glycosyltransferase n=1 Tax=Roseateles sp. DB2 TaxID=3453717 RepID=UPI003EE929D4